MSSKVKVGVRVRPLNKRELDIGTNVVIDMNNNQTILLPTSTQKTPRTFAFDHCFSSMDDKKLDNQEVVFAALGTDVLNSAFEGYNACIFAYGQTGSGKSYTMMGAGNEEHHKGIIPRLCDNLFARISQNTDPQLSFTVEVSYMEIYNEKVRDLLKPKYEKDHLKLREHLVLGPYVENLSKLAVRSIADINKLMSEGNKLRTVAATQMNADSSRSHTVFSIVLTQTLFDPATHTGLEKVSKMSLVDLAGSERVSKTGAEGDGLKDGSNINKSLTTLGTVISALAEQGAAAKKGKTGFVPYRDSTLTWLLKDNLGGNSRTVMVATISPAEDSYKETLSTLLYADRAKRIVNHAVINQDLNSRVIRELHEEAKKLHVMLTKGGGEEEPTGMGNQELVQLKDKLKISETLMAEMSKSWEQKLAETARIHKECQMTLENMGISVLACSISVQPDKFYLVNLNADPTMNELLVCYLKDLTRVGRPNVHPPQNICLQGLGITDEHCIIQIVNREVFLTPMSGSRTLVNGIVITEITQLRHGGRIMLGNNHLFRLNCPGQSSMGIKPIGYEQAMQEISHNELIKDPLYCKMQQELAQKHEVEKEGALEAQRAKYEKELSQLKEQLESAHLKESGHPILQLGSTHPRDQLSIQPKDQLESVQLKGSMDAVQSNERVKSTQYREQYKTTYPSPNEHLASSAVPAHLPTMSTPILTANKHKPPQSLEEEWVERNRERLLRVVVDANRLAQEANMLAKALHKDTVFKVTLAVPVSFLSPQKQSTETTNEVAIRVLHKQHGTDHVWSLDTLHEKVLAMREMYQRMEEGSSLIDATMGAEPFYDLEQHVLLGVANIFLECLHHSVPHDYPAPIIAPTGMECGKLRVILQRVPIDNEEVDTGVLEVADEESELRPGMVMRCQVTLVEAVGLPKKYCHNMFCQYKFWGEQDTTIIPPLLQQEKLPDGVQRFNHTKVVNIEITEEFLEYLDEGVLSFEVWGFPRSGFSDKETAYGAEDKSKTFSERWAELATRLELWVDIMELNEQGEYYPVEMQGRQDLMTGGMFIIKQGKSKRVRVTVTQITPGSHLKMDHITSIAIGSIYVRNRLDESLDSYQEQDLERLRARWTDALMCRRDYLDAEVRKLMDKKEQTAADLEEQNELLDQWAVLEWQRSAVLQPKAGSGIPGAPNNWHVEPEKELRAPVLFLDLNDDLETPCDDDPLKAVRTGELMGEREDTMRELPLIKDAKREEKECVKVQASWDTTVHETNCLNRVIDDKDRVFAIVKVSVQLIKPPGIVLVLRKRICLKVYKKPSYLGSFTVNTVNIFRSFTAPKETRNGCGIVYEVVTGIPMFKRMNKQPFKIPANPSCIELEEDDNAIEKLKKAMYSISNMLALDKLKQKVSLQEKLANIGETLGKRYTYMPSTSPPAVSPPLSRASSGVIIQSDQLLIEREDGRSSLMIACHNGQYGVVKTLILAGADVNKANKNGRSPLMIASHNGHLEVVKTLIEAGANVNQADKDDTTPLYWASSSGHHYVVQTLLGAGADANVATSDDGTSSLMTASYEGHLDVVKTLIEAGANVNHANKMYATPLYMACIEGHHDIVHTLLGAGADVNIATSYDNKSPLVIASENGHLDVVKTLIEAGANVNHATNKNGRSSLMTASHYGHLNLIKILIEAGADVNQADHKSYETPLYLASMEGHHDIVQTLLGAGAEVKIATLYDGMSPLMTASNEGHLDVVKTLIKAGADINHANKDGDTPLHLAAREGHTTCVVLILSTPGIDVNIQNHKKQTPLMVATKFDVITLLQKCSTCHKDYPIHTFNKVILCGNTGAGKSSLAKAIIESSILARRSGNIEKSLNLDEVAKPLTAGIVAYQIQNSKSNMMLYDFAGHHTYYSSHSSLLEAISLTSPSTFLMLVDATVGIVEITKQMYYWFDMINNVCHECPQPSSVIMVGTHADMVTKKVLINIGVEIENKARHILKRHIFVHFITLNATRRGHIDLKGFLDLLDRVNYDVLQRSPAISLSIHLMYAFLRDKVFINKDAIPLSYLLSVLDEANSRVLPTETSEIVALLTTLAEKGFILFFHTDSDNSWIVLDQGEFLEKVNGALFAPSFFKEHLPIASNTGIIPVEALKRHFPNRNTAMIVQFLIQLQLCQRISLIGVTTNMAPDIASSSDLLFFPSHILEGRPHFDCSDITTPEKYFGWLLCVDSMEHFFSNRFLHTLLLDLAYGLCLPHKGDQISIDIQSNNRRCKVWNTGISWRSVKGVSTVVEMMEDSRSLFMLMSFPDPKFCNEMAPILLTIKTALGKYCQSIAATEYIVDPSTASQVFTQGCSPKSLTRVQLSHLRDALLNNDPTVVDFNDNVVFLDKWFSVQPNLPQLICIVGGLSQQQQAPKINPQNVSTSVVTSSSQLMSEQAVPVCTPVVSSYLSQQLRSQLTVSQLEEEPTMPLLLRFSASKMNIAEQIGVKYYKFGIHLLEDKTGAIVNAVELEYSRNAERINIAILQQWLQGKGVKPVTWLTLVTVLNDTGI